MSDIYKLMDLGFSARMANSMNTGCYDEEMDSLYFESDRKILPSRTSYLTLEEAEYYFGPAA